MGATRFERSGNAVRLAAGWSALGAAGLPDGPVRAMDGDRFDDGEVQAAVRELGAAVTSLDQTSRELLQSWLRALRDHFPSRFSALLGADGTRLIAALDETEIDLNRFIKFRRIAIERLARLI